MTESVKTRKSVKGTLHTENWERLTRLEFVVQQLVKDSERMDNRIDEIAKSQANITRIVRKTYTIIIAGFLSLLLQAPELVKDIPALLKLLTNTP